MTFNEKGDNVQQQYGVRFTREENLGLVVQTGGEHWSGIIDEYGLINITLETESL